MKASRALLALTLALTGCRDSGREEGHANFERGKEARAEQTATPDLFRIQKEMLRDLRITTAKAEDRSQADTVEALGEVRVNEDAYAEVVSPIAARVSRLLAATGDRVRQGGALAEIQSIDLGKARAEHASASARAELARQALARKRGLVEERIAPQRELQEAEAEAAAAEAALRSAAVALDALGASGSRDPGSRLTLRSPISGIVIERTAVLGQATDPARPLFRIGDLSRLWLTVHVFERDAVRVRIAAPASVTFPALPGREFQGTVTLIGRQVDTSSRTIPVRVQMKNEEGTLRPGMSATAKLSLGEAGARVVAVPAGALQRLSESWCVFVPRAQGEFEIRRVGRGRDLGGEVEVVSGLKAGENVVVEGAFLLKAEADKSRGEGKEHQHD